MRFVIIGNGVAGISAALALRAGDQSAEITVVSGESDFFFSRPALMYAYMNRMRMRDLEPQERGTYRQKRIELKRAWVRDLDATTRRIQLADGTLLGYDKVLIATGSTPRSLTHSAREGVVHFVSLQDLEECERLTPSTKQAVVIGGGLIGVELVECLAYHGVSVTFLLRDQWYWPMALCQQEGELVAKHMRRHGVNVVFHEEFAAAETDPVGRVRAITTQGGRHLPCQMLGIAIGVRPAIDWLRSVSTPPALGHGILTTPAFETSLENVYAAGDCADVREAGVEQMWYSAKRQGELAAQRMLGHCVHYTAPTFFNSAKFFELEYTTVGRLTATARSACYQEPKREISMRIAAENNQITAFNMIGSRWNHRILANWIEQRRSPAEVLAMLPQAQFDVEFGRFDLESARAHLQRELGL